MAFLFYELSKHPEVQQTLRLEIMETMAKVKTQGQCDVSVKDLDGMAYTLAVIKVVSRLCHSSQVTYCRLLRKACGYTRSYMVHS